MLPMPDGLPATPPDPSTSRVVASTQLLPAGSLLTISGLVTNVLSPITTSRPVSEAAFDPAVPARNDRSNAIDARRRALSTTPLAVPSPSDLPLTDPVTFSDRRAVLASVVLAAAVDTTRADVVGCCESPQPTSATATAPTNGLHPLIPVHIPWIGMPATPKTKWKRPTRRRVRAIRDRLRAAYGKPV